MNFGNSLIAFLIIFITEYVMDFDGELYYGLDKVVWSCDLFVV